MDRALKRETIFAALGVVFILLGIIAQNVLNEHVIVAVLFALAFIVGGYYKAKEGVLNTLKERHLNVEMLMIIAALAAFIIESYFEAAILIIIFSISGVMESFANKKSEKELKSLLSLAPQTAVLYKEGEEETVSLDAVEKNDVLIVKVGEQVPVDSVIQRGQTGVDQSAITGEFVPAPKQEGDTVYAGAINMEGTIIVRAVKSPGDSVIQKIIKFVEDAQNDQPSKASAIDRFERVYVYVVVAMALAFMIIPPLTGLLPLEEALYRGIIVLVVGSPCALVASIAPAVLSALSNASRKHILIKGGSILETMPAIDVVLLDKTGTITTGTPEVHAIHVHDIDSSYAERLLYSMERQSNHPMARAITKHLEGTDTLKEIETKEVPGSGMEASIDGRHYKVGRFEAVMPTPLQALTKSEQDAGKSSVNLIEDGRVVAVVLLSDTIRKDAVETIAYLNANDIMPVMVSGDTEASARGIAREVGIETIHGQCMPQDKVTIINQYKHEGRTVMVIGDGINDAPALQVADVAIAMGTATDVSLETSDIVFIDDALNNLSHVMRLAKRLRTTMTMNIALSISVIALLLMGNVFGLITLPFGVLAHELSTIFVILNSLRLLIK